MAIKVVIADDTDFMRRAIRRILESDTRIEVVGEAVNFTQAIEMLNSLKPDVIVLDLHMPDFTPATSSTFASNSSLGASRVIAISIWDDDEAKVLAKSFGSVAFVSKLDVGQKLNPIILQSVARQTFAARA